MCKAQLEVAILAHWHLRRSAASQSAGTGMSSAADAGMPPASSDLGVLDSRNETGRETGV